MTENIQKKLAFLKEGEYKKLRRPLAIKTIVWEEGANEMDMQTALLKHMLQSEEPLLYENDIFGFNRTINETPEGFIGKQGYGLAIGNVTPNYEYALEVGMDAILGRIRRKMEECTDKGKQIFYNAMYESISACLEFADRYKKYALEKGNTFLYDALCQVPHKPAETFHQACIFVKFDVLANRFSRAFADGRGVQMCFVTVHGVLRLG